MLPGLRKSFKKKLTAIGLPLIQIINNQNQEFSIVNQY